MNKIYNFNDIEKIQAEQKRLIFRYVAYALAFIVALVLTCIFIENNLLIAVITFVLLTGFVLFSIVFWKVKYGILKTYGVFLDNMESGKRNDCVGVFEGRAASDENADFDSCIFAVLSKKIDLLIHKQNPTRFEEGKKYHLECVGNYVYGWEVID